MASDKIMCWVKDARNHVVKKGDLESTSVARISILASYYDQPYTEFEVPPQLSNTEILKKISTKKIPKDILENGVLKVERRWVVNGLENYEVTEALSEACDYLYELIKDAHVKIDNLDQSEVDDMFESLKEMLPSQMFACDEHRISHFQLPSLEPLNLSQIRVEKDETLKKDLEKKYGKLPDRVPSSSSLKDLVAFHSSYAERLLSVDGFCVPAVFFLKGSAIVHLMSPMFENKSQKYLLSRFMAKEVKRVGADGVIVIVESWIAHRPPKDPYESLEKAEDRKEVLQAIGINSSGEEYSLVTPFSKVEGKIRIEDRRELGGEMYFLEPIKAFWRNNAKTRGGPEGAAL